MRVFGTAWSESYRSPNRAYALSGQLIDAARGVPDVVIETNEATCIQEMRFAGGWHLNATWHTPNDGYIRRMGDWPETKCSVGLYNSYTQERYRYVNDVYDNEAVVSETPDHEKRATLEAIGYDVYNPGGGGWTM